MVVASTPNGPSGDKEQGPADVQNKKTRGGEKTVRESKTLEAAEFVNDGNRKLFSRKRTVYEAMVRAITGEGKPS